MSMRILADFAAGQPGFEAAAVIDAAAFLFASPLFTPLRHHNHISPAEERDTPSSSQTAAAIAVKCGRG